MRDALQVIAVCALLALAGCGGAGGGTTTHANTTNTTTNGTTNATTTAQAAYPPGVSASGVTDVAALVGAHQDALTGTAYTVTRVRNTTYANGTVRSNTTETTQFAASHATFRTVYAATGTVAAPIGVADGRARFWSNGTDVFRSLAAGGNATYERIGGRPKYLHSDYYERLYVVFSVTNTTTAGTTTRGGQTLYEVTATGATYPGDLVTVTGADDVSDVSLTAYVSERGVVREYRLSYTVTTGNQTFRVRESATFSNVGDTAVEKPSWVPTAVNATASN